MRILFMGMGACVLVPITLLVLQLMLNFAIVAKAQRQFGDDELCSVGIAERLPHGRKTWKEPLVRRSRMTDTLLFQTVRHDRWYHIRYRGRPIHFGVVVDGQLYGFSHGAFAFYPVPDHVSAWGREAVVDACAVADR